VPEPSNDAESSNRGSSSIRVLVVDAFDPLAILFLNILAANHYDVRVADTGEKALRIAEHFRPHALIADVTLPDMGGFELAAEFEIQHPDCRVILMRAGGLETPKGKNVLRVVQKASVLEEALRLLDGLQAAKED